MEYYYTRKDALRNSSFKKLAVIALILVAVLISYAASAQTCTINVTISAVNVSCNAGNDGSAVASASGGSGSYSYAWSTFPVQTTATAIGLSAGTFNVTVTDTSGCIGAASVSITEPAIPLSVSISVSDPDCFRAGSALASASGGTSPYSYSWSTDPSQDTAVATGLAGGSYTVTVTDANNCTAAQTATVDTAIRVTAAITGISRICIDPDYPRNISLMASGGTSFMWSNGSTTNGAVVTPTVTTTYSVIVSNPAGCSDTAYHTITIDIMPEAWISGAASICAGDAVTLTGNGSGSYSWSTGDTSKMITVSPSATGSFMLTVTNGTCIDTISHTVAVTAPPAVAITGCLRACANAEAVEYAIPSVAGAASYTWTVPSGWSVVSGQGTNTISVKAGSIGADGAITVATTGTSCNNYSISLDVDVVSCNDDISIPTAFTPNSDGNNDTWEIKNISGYPLNTLSILNRWGNEVFRTTGYDNTWGGNDLQEGTYFYVLSISQEEAQEGCATGVTSEKLHRGFVTIIR